MCQIRGLITPPVLVRSEPYGPQDPICDQKGPRMALLRVAAGLSEKNAARLRHLRSTWDLHIRAFNETHPTVPWPKLLHNYLWSYSSKIPQQIKMELGSWQSWILLAVSFLCVVLGPSQPPWSHGKSIFSVCPFLMANPAVGFGNNFVELNGQSHAKEVERFWRENLVNSPFQNCKIAGKRDQFLTIVNLDTKNTINEMLKIPYVWLQVTTRFSKICSFV